MFLTPNTVPYVRTLQESPFLILSWPTAPWNRNISVCYLQMYHEGKLIYSIFCSAVDESHYKILNIGFVLEDSCYWIGVKVPLNKSWEFIYLLVACFVPWSCIFKLCWAGIYYRYRRIEQSLKPNYTSQNKVLGLSKIESTAIDISFSHFKIFMELKKKIKNQLQSH